jgi:hypothetical protein
MSKKKTTEEFIIESKKIFKDKYNYTLTNYITNHDKVKIICSLHGIFEIRPNDHLSKKIGCQKCFNASISKSLNTGKRIIDDFVKIHGNKYDYSLVEYNGTDKKVKIICSSHGLFEQTPHHHRNGIGCAKCGGVAKLTTDEFILKSKKIHGEKYDYKLVNYKNVKTKVLLICPIHGEFNTTPNDHLRRTSGCPICNESKGEKKIREILIEKNVNFTQQKRFKDCRDKNPLPFDFYLPDLNACIEYDGEQHFNERCTFGGKKRLNDIQKKDKLKNEFCLNNNIKLLRIKYNDIILEKLKKII